MQRGFFRKSRAAGRRFLRVASFVKFFCFVTPEGHIPEGTCHEEIAEPFEVVAGKSPHCVCVASFRLR